VAIQLTYKTGVGRVRTKADQDQPAQDSSGRFSEGATTRGSLVWKRKLISDREDNKACKKRESVHSESMTRRQKQVFIISVVFAPGSAQCCQGDVDSSSEATWFGARSLSLHHIRCVMEMPIFLYYCNSLATQEDCEMIGYCPFADWHQ